MKNNITILVALAMVIIIGGYIFIQQNESNTPEASDSSESEKNLFDIDYKEALLTLADVGADFQIENEVVTPSFTDEATIYNQSFLRFGAGDAPLFISQTITLPFILNKLEPILAEKIEKATNGDDYYLESQEIINSTTQKPLTIYRIRNNSAAGRYITYTAFLETSKFGGSVVEIFVVDINKYRDELLAQLVLTVQNKISSITN